MVVKDVTDKFDAFHALDPAKKTAILNAAFEEFGEKGFQRASTNAIVAKAGIGKGTLFYYFNSKDALYAFVCEYTLEFLQNKYPSPFLWGTGDFIERLRILTERKRHILIQSPPIAKFAESMAREDSTEPAGHYLKKIMEIRASIMKMLYDDLDYTLFRRDMAPEQIIKYIHWMINAYEDDLIARFQTGEVGLGKEEAVAEEWRRFTAFLDDVRTLFYRRDTECR